MKASKELKKQMFIELFALLLLVSSVIYALVMLKSSNSSKIVNYDDVVTVLDDSKFKKLKISSDGEGLNTDGVTYTITNNRKQTITYDLVILPNIHDEDVLKNIRVGFDDVFLYNLTELERASGGYLIEDNTLNPGYTKIHALKMWYKNSTDSSLKGTEIAFDYKLNIRQD